MTGVQTCALPISKILCSDDVLYPHCLEHQIKLFNEYKTSIVFNRRDILLPSGRKISPQTPSYVKSINANDAFAIYIKSGRNIFGEPVSALIRTKDLLESEGFSDLHQYTLDLSGYYEISKNKQVTFDKEIVGFFRVSKAQWSYKIRHKQNSAQLYFKRELMKFNYVNVYYFDFILGELKGRLFTLLRSLIYKLG